MFELKMPKLGESVTEGTIGKWLKRPGDKVNKYDLLVEVEGESLKEVALFVSEKLATIQGVLSTATHFMLKPYKEHGVLMGRESNEERLAVTP